jgi:hypothetical protein
VAERKATVFERIAEQRIREAMNENKFSVSQPGRRIDLEGYFQTPPDLRLGFSVLKSAGCVPEEVDLLNELAALRRALSETTGPEERVVLQKQIGRVRLRLDLALERARQRRSGPA